MAKIVKENNDGSADITINFPQKVWLKLKDDAVRQIQDNRTFEQAIDKIIFDRIVQVR